MIIITKPYQSSETRNFSMIFAFLVDMLNHLNDLNTKLQSNDQFISNLYHHGGGFHGRLELWEQQFTDGEVDVETFPTLTERPGFGEDDTAIHKYRDLITALKQEFEARFIDFKDMKDELCAFSAPLRADIPNRHSVDTPGPSCHPLSSAEIFCNSLY